MHMRKCLQIQFIPSNTIKTSQPLNQIYSLREHQFFYHIKIQRIRIVPDKMYQTGEHKLIGYLMDCTGVCHEDRDNDGF